MFKKIMIHTRRGMKFIVLFMIAAFLIVGAVAFLYKPTYSVFINGEQVGYTENRTGLQHKINDYIEKGEGSNNVAFVQVANLPEYKLCLLKKNIVTNDDEIFNDIKQQGVTYYRYYAIVDNQEEKAYVSNFEEAENVVNGLKEKNSSNIENMSIVEKYETELKDLVSSEEAVAKLYVEAPKTIAVAKKTSSTVKYTSTGSVNTNLTTAGGKLNLGISLIKPVSGTISSRFRVGSSIRSSSHTVLDIAAPLGTPIKAAASGTVTFAGWKGSYGNMLVISHGNNVQTYYAHCSKLSASVGTSISQGLVIGAVGSTGNSTGPHLHFEIRVNGIAYNPQNYLY